MRGDAGIPDLEDCGKSGEGLFGIRADGRGFVSGGDMRVRGKAGKGRTDQQGRREEEDGRREG